MGRARNRTRQVGSKCLRGRGWRDRAAERDGEGGGRNGQQGVVKLSQWKERNDGKTSVIFTTGSLRN